jgi:ribonuclease R
MGPQYLISAFAVADGMATRQALAMPRGNLRDAVLDHMRAHPTQPMTKSSLARQLEVPVERRSELRKAIEALVSEGLIHEGKKACYMLRAKTGNTLTGTLKFHPKGHAFFFPDATDETNLATGLDLVALNRIHIPRRDAGTALDGDRVLISLQKPSPKRPFRTRSEIIPDTPDEPRGKVDKILSRRSGRLVGIFRKEKGFSWIDCEDKAVDGRVELTGDTTAQPGQLVVVDLENWKDPGTTPRGRIIEVLGWPGDPGVDMIAVIHRFGLRTSFPDEVLAAARAVPEEVEPAEIARRRIGATNSSSPSTPPMPRTTTMRSGWKKPATAGARRAHRRCFHYIKPGSPMDKEAVEARQLDLSRGPRAADAAGGAFQRHLLAQAGRRPPHQVRFVGNFRRRRSHQGRFIDAVIHSRAKLSYEQAQAILDGKPAPKNSDPQLVTMVREAWKLASTMRRRRSPTARSISKCRKSRSASIPRPRLRRRAGDPHREPPTRRGMHARRQRRRRESPARAHETRRLSHPRGSRSIAADGLHRDRQTPRLPPRRSHQPRAHPKVVR